MPGRFAAVVGLIVAAGVAGVFWWVLAAPVPAPAAKPPAASTKASDDDDPIVARIENTGPRARWPDFFRVIDAPRFLNVTDAAGSMSDDEIVLGLDVAGERRAYSINYLNDHEMVREEIAGLPLLVTW